MQGAVELILLLVTTCPCATLTLLVILPLCGARESSHHIGRIGREVNMILEVQIDSEEWMFTTCLQTAM